jgi:hypothetical protein
MPGLATPTSEEPPAMAKLNSKIVRELIETCRGNAAAIARSVGVKRQSVVGFIKRRPPLAEALKDARETLVDEAESALALAVDKGEAWAVCFTLKCLGKNRGYVERQELTGANGGPVEAKVSPDQYNHLTLDEKIKLMRERTGMPSDN